MPAWRIFLILSISTCFFLLPVETLNGCGGGDMSYPEDEFSYLIKQELVDAHGYDAFFLYYPSTYYPVGIEEEVYGAEQNLKEWQAFTGNKILQKNLAKLVYENPPATLLGIYHHLSNKGNTFSEPDVWSYFDDPKNKEILLYLHYVRMLQPFVSGLSEWEGCSDLASNADSLIMKGENLIKKSNTTFIKLRLAYQLSRLAHYSNQYEKAIGYYDTYFSKDKTESIIKYRALGHKAGSLKALERLGEAMYCFSIVFSHSLEKSQEAFKSIYYEGEGFDEALNLCKTPEEKVTLYFLQGLEHADTYVEGLMKIMELSPNSKELAILTMRELKKQEAETTSYFGSTSNREEGQPMTLKDFILMCSANEKIVNKPLWNFLSGYIAYLNKDLDQTTAYLNKVKTNDVLLSNHVRIVQTLVKIDKQDSIDADSEKMMLNEFAWLKSMGSETDLFDHARDYYLSNLSKRYVQQGELLKAQLCQNKIRPIDMYDGIDQSLVNNFFSFQIRSQKSPMEQFLAENFKYTLEELYDIKGTMALRTGNFKEAIDFFSKGKGGIVKSFENPFDKAPINNCINCEGEGEEGEESTSSGISKVDFAKTMIEYETLASKDPKKAAENYYKMGCGMFNTTYYGSSWQLMDYRRSVYSGGSTEDPFYSGKSDEELVEYYNKRKAGTSSKIHYDCTLAMKYFVKAMELTSDKNLGAQACYMASKCEESNRYTGIVSIPDGLGKHFYYNILKSKYADTEYYQDVINECKYFNNYVNAAL